MKKIIVIISAVALLKIFNLTFPATTSAKASYLTKLFFAGLIVRIPIRSPQSALQLRANASNHIWLNDYLIDFDSARVIDG